MVAGKLVGILLNWLCMKTSASVKDGALVVIFADDYYGATKQSIGNVPNRGSIVFVGYIIDGSISVNYRNIFDGIFRWLTYRR